MTQVEQSPTPYPEINALLQEVLERARAVLGSHFIAMYLEGSLTSGAFDQDSDIDFVIVTDEEVSPALFEELRAIHEQISTHASPWAIQLEGSYISQATLRRHDADKMVHPNLERGQGERLKLAVHDTGWNIHRSILRERGFTLAGPPPASLIDPVAPDDLRQAMVTVLEGWASRLLENPEQLHHRGYQSYTMLSLCRILYTLAYGAVASKPVAAAWAQQTLGERWQGLIDRAWAGRSQPDQKADPEDVNGTLKFIRYALEQIQKSE